MATAAFVLLLLAGACTTSPDPAPPEAPETGPLDVLLEREVTLPRTTRVSAPDGSFRGKAASRGRVTLERTEVSYYGSFDIGTSGPIECHVLDESNDASVSLVALSESYLEELGANLEVGQKQLLSVDAGVAGATPYLGLDWLVAVDDVGFQLKLKYANKGDRSLYCVHAETGYTRAFDDFFAGFLESLDVPGMGRSAAFEEVTLVTIGDLRVGYQSLRMTPDAAGDLRIETQVSLLIPAGPGAVSSSDEYSVEWSRPDGRLINQKVASNDGLVVNELDLANLDGIWVVSGSVQGKPITKTFETQDPLMSSLVGYHHLRSVARGELTGEMRYTRWLGAVRPGAGVDHSLRVGDASTVTIDAGPVTLHAEADELGSPRGTLEAGRLVMGLERAYVDGSL